jgi:hypothetical protein
MIVGAVSAAITWGAVYYAIHEPSVHQRPDGRIVMVLCGPGDDDDLTALVWAGGAYVLTFTPTLLLLHGRTPRDVFTQRPSQG